MTALLAIAVVFLAVAALAALTLLGIFVALFIRYWRDNT